MCFESIRIECLLDPLAYAPAGLHGLMAVETPATAAAAQARSRRRPRGGWTLCRTSRRDGRVVPARSPAQALEDSEARRPPPSRARPADHGLMAVETAVKWAAVMAAL